MSHEQQNPFGDDLRMAQQDTPVTQQDTPVTQQSSYRNATGHPHQFHRWDVRMWTKWNWILVFVLLSAVIAVPVIVVTVKKKQNRYPDYAPINYRLSDTISGTNFFDNFNYFTGYDPTQGFVHYVPAEAANDPRYNLTFATSSSAILKVDTNVTAESDPNASTGRFSVRIESKKHYSSGLFIFDVIHTPTGCATWPALWLTDPSNWPANGEIDVMEAVNVVSDAQSQVTLHTSSGCSMNVKKKETGNSISTNCANRDGEDPGCGVEAGTKTFGSSFNANGGGVAATELRTDGIRVWHFPRSFIPADILSGKPDPSTWGTATADFPNSDCDIGSHFRNQSIIANIDLCGSWAGAPKVYGKDCPGTCTDYVANNNTAFADSYWEFGAFSVYQAS